MHDDRSKELEINSSKLPNQVNRRTIETPSEQLFENISIGAGSELLAIPEVARLLNASVSTVRRLQERRLLAFVKVARGIRFERAAITSFLKKNRVEPIE